MPESWQPPLDLKGSDLVNFDIYESVNKTIDKYKLHTILCKNKDVNEEEYSEKIKNSSVNFVVFAGWGGQILKPNILSQGKPILHVHPGIVPEFRGSTTVYYSMLSVGKVGASAFFMSTGIDEGQLITQKEFDINCDIDIDYLYDVEIRGIVLVEAVKKILSGIASIPQKNDKYALPYFKIHPTLKHIALLMREINK
ncbi:MAG: hypothetical protein IJT36_05275 [Alphaproteobacteria bacterium]|nr:hypothetical protein [Alphaproteobacteria bacterium]